VKDEERSYGCQSTKRRWARTDNLSLKRLSWRATCSGPPLIMLKVQSSLKEYLGTRKRAKGASPKIALFLHLHLLKNPYAALHSPTATKKPSTNPPTPQPIAPPPHGLLPQISHSTYFDQHLIICPHNTYHNRERRRHVPCAQRLVVKACFAPPYSEKLKMLPKD